MSRVDIIAEIGSNHGGDLACALAHIEAAAAYGCDGVKFQLFRAATLDSREEVQETLRRYELPGQWLPDMSAAARALGLRFGLSLFSVDLAEALQGQTILDFVKISAYDLTYDRLLSAATSLHVPMVLSTAMATWAEIEHAVPLCLPGSVTLLHGVAAYPAAERDMRVGVVAEMVRRFDSRCGVGLSDHTRGAHAAVLAVLLGARMVEKHFKLRSGPDSPDRPHSLNEIEMRAFVEEIRAVEALLANCDKAGPLPVERPLYETCRRTNEKPLRG